MLLAVAVATGALTLTAGWWFPGLVVLLGFLEANSETVSVLADVATLISIVGTVVAIILGFLGVRGWQRGGGWGTASSTVVEVERGISVSGNITAPVITGDHSQVRYELGEDLYEHRRAMESPLGTAPPVPDMFVGRSEDLRELKLRFERASKSEATAAPVQVLTAVRGWPGVGKTALAAALAHDEEVRQMFPDGVLFASLGQAPDVLSMVVAWARSLGAADLSDAETVSEASGRLRAAMMDKRALLILDDVWEAAHAVPLTVGGPCCGTLVTTRLDRVARDISPDASGIYRLKVLPEEEALQLLDQLAPGAVAEHPERSHELVRELDGLPLALRVAGGLLAAEASAGFGAGELLEELREGKRLLEEEAPASYQLASGEVSPTIAALLRRSTDRLDALRRKRFALLGVLAPRPVSFGQNAAQDVWGTKQDPRPTLRALLDRGLLESAGEGRFQMHSLLSAFATSLLEQDPKMPGIEEARRRYLKHYEIVLGVTNLYFEEGGEAMERALAYFDLDWEAIRTAYALAASRMEEDEVAARFVDDYVGAGANVLAFRLSSQEYIRWIELALRAARHIEDADSVRVRNANLGAAHLMAGHYREAVDYCEEALASAHDAGDREGEGAAHGNLASAYDELGDGQRALDHATSCLGIAREVGDRRTEAKALGALGEVYAGLGRPDDALRHLKGQKDVAKDIGDTPSEARALRKLGKFYRDTGHPWRAAVFFEVAASVFQRLKDFSTFHGVLLSHGILCVQREDYDRALGIFDRVIESAEQKDDGHAKAQALMNQGNVYDLLERGSLAEDLYRRAIETALEAGAEHTVGDASWNLAQVLEAKGDRKGAISTAREALTVYRSTGDMKVEMVRSWMRDRGTA